MNNKFSNKNYYDYNALISNYLVKYFISQNYYLFSNGKKVFIAKKIKKTYSRLTNKNQNKGSCLNNTTYYPYIENNRIFNLYFCIFDKHLFKYLLNNNLLVRKINTKNFNNLIILENYTQILNQNGGFVFNPVKWFSIDQKPLYDNFFRPGLSIFKSSLNFFPMSENLKKPIFLFCDLLKGNNPIGNSLPFFLGNEFGFRIFSIGTKAIINSATILSNGLVPVGAGIETISTSLDATGVGAAVGVVGNMVGVAAEAVPTVTNLLKQFLSLLEYLNSISEFSNSLNKLQSSSGGKHKYSHKNIKKKKKNYIKQLGSGSSTEPPEILGIKGLLEQFFFIPGPGSIPPFKLNNDLFDSIKSLNYTIPSLDESVPEQTIEIRNAVVSMFKYIEPIVESFMTNPKNAEDVEKCCSISEEIITSITRIISNLITVILQYDNGVMGQYLEILVSKSRPDKIYEIIKQFIKIIPESIISILINPSLMEKIIDTFINTSIKLINDNPQQIINILRENFACMNIKVIEDLLQTGEDMFSPFRAIIVGNIKSRFEPYLKESLLSLYLVIPMLIIFGYIYSSCYLQKNSNVNSDDDDNQDDEEKESGKSGPFALKEEQIKELEQKFKISTATIPIFAALCKETSISLNK